MKKRPIIALFLAIALCIAVTACSVSSGTVEVHTPDSDAVTTPVVSEATEPPLTEITSKSDETTDEITTDESQASSEKTDEPIDSEETTEPVTQTTPQTSVTTTELSETEKTEETVITTAATTASTTTPVATTTKPVVTTTTATTAQNPPAPPSKPTILLPVASGTKTESNTLGTIDYSNTSDGYIMAKYTGKATKVKCQVKGPDGVTQTYNLRTDGVYETFPLSAGNGKYTVLIAENVSGTSYAVAAQLVVDVSLSSSLAPFLRPNQYADYDSDSSAVKKASELCAGADSVLEKVDRIYTWIVDNVSYDTALAASVKSGYLPDTERVLSVKKGICLDYAGTATVMLRSQNVPTQLVVGYAGEAYHAWINVYVKEKGWVYGVIYFDGSGWQRMDPTFASTGNSGSDVLQYIGNGKNYSQKYLY